MSNENIFEDIKELSNKWYSLIRADHHKDRDCHWHIETRWSYGKDPVYVVYHYGYINKEVAIKADSYESALKILRDQIEQAIEIQRDNAVC